MTTSTYATLGRSPCRAAALLVLLFLSAGCDRDAARRVEEAASPNAALAPAAAPDAHRGDAAERAQMTSIVDALLAQMTVEEKIGQLTSFSSSWSTTGPTLREGYREDIRAGRVGSVFNAFTAAYTRELQALAVEETRLGIPLLFGYDVIHGHRTIFPIPLGEAASWDLEAIERSARVAATEAAAEGIHWTFAPMVDIARDPRWGRIAEGAGEDAWLGSRIAAARVHGFQGDDLSAPDTVLATAKHFAAYGAAQAGRDYHTTDLSDRELRETYLPPFKAAVDAGVGTIMTAFNDLNGVPASANAYLISDILRGEWGFDGFVVSDYTSINELVPHGFARDEAHAAELALAAGVDMDLQGAVYLTHLKAALDREGAKTLSRIDAAVRRILGAKHRLGLFDDPYRYSDPEREAAEILRPEHLEAARDMARRSMVLLKNEGGLLPLSGDTRSIALIGPLADSEEDMLGCWAAAGERKGGPVTLLEGLEARLGDSTAIRHARGADYELGSLDRSGFDKALAAARASDVVVVAMGERADMTGEAASRTSLDLPGTQQELLQALHGTGKPIVLVLMSGRPLAIPWADAQVDAVLEAWYPGTMGGHAIADVLFGDYNPSGKLPVTFPRNVGQVPIYYNMKNTGRPYTTENVKYVSRYLATPNTPLYPFGYGLSYTRFSYSDIELDRSEILPGESLTATVTVTNTGEYDGEEVVQLYIQDLVGSVTRPVKQLKSFRKIRLEQGESRQVSFVLSEADLAFYRYDRTWGAEPGEFRLYIGGSSEDVRAAAFALLPAGTVSSAGR